MSSIERVLWVLVGLLGVIMTGILILAIAIPDFRTIAPTLATALIGPLVTVISGLGSALAARAFKEVVDQEGKNNG